MTVTTLKVPTSQGDIAVVDTHGQGLPVVLIHGNSCCKEVFSRQLESPLGQSFRLIAIDLPGHGASSNARDPGRVYSMSGFAEVVVELLGAMGVARAAVYGWSLGGHVALEMVARFQGLVGLMISGASPVTPTMESIQAGHRPHPLMVLAGKEVLTPEEIDAMAASIFGDALTPALRAAIVRTDGRMRRMIFEALFDGRTADHRAIAENSPVPLAIVNGADDPLVNIEYVGGLSYRNLWDGHCFVLRDQAHVPFMTDPRAFNAILERFLRDMAERAQRRPIERAGRRLIRA